MVLPADEHENPSRHFVREGFFHCKMTQYDRSEMRGADMT